MTIDNDKTYQSLTSSKEKEQMPNLQVDTDDFLQLQQWVPMLLSPAELEQIQGLEQNIQSQFSIWILYVCLNASEEKCMYYINSSCTEGQSVVMN